MSQEPATEGTEHHHTPTTLSQSLLALQANEEAVKQAEIQLQRVLAEQVHLCYIQRTLEHRQLLEVVEKGISQQWLHHGQPVLAMVIHRCLLHWQALNNPDHAGQAMLEGLARALARHIEDSHTTAATGASNPTQLGSLSHTAYWLTVSSVALSLLHTLQPAHNQGAKGAGGLVVGLEDEPAKDSAAKLAMGHVKNKMMSFGNMLKQRHFGAQQQQQQQQEPAQHAGGVDDGSSTVSTVTRHDSSMDEKVDGTRTSSVSSHKGMKRLDSSGSTAGGAEGVTAHSLKAPLVFMNQLDQLMLSCYSCIFDTFKKSLSQVLADCIQAPPPPSIPPTPKPSSTSLAQEVEQQEQPAEAPSSSQLGQDSSLGSEAQDGQQQPQQQSPEQQENQSKGETTEQPGQRLQGQISTGVPESDPQSPASTAAARSEQQQHEAEEGQQVSASQRSHAPAPWSDLVGLLQYGLQELRSQHVPRILIKCIYKQILAFINLQLFNQLLLRPDCCSASNARYLLSGLRALDAWLLAGAPGTKPPDATMLKPLYPELRHTRQAVGFLVCPNKGALSVEDITTNLCPALNSQQIYRLCTTFHEDSEEEPDAQCTHMVSGEVLEGLKEATGVHNNGGLIVTFLLDDDHTLIVAPQGSTVDEVLSLINRKELYGPLPLPAEFQTDTCPRAVFEWMESPVPMPPALEKSKR